MSQTDPFSQLGREWEAKREQMNKVAREDLARATALKHEAKARHAKRREVGVGQIHSDLFNKRPNSAERKRRRREDYKNALDAQIKEKPSTHGILRYRPAIGPNGVTAACFGSRRNGEISTPPERQSRSKICNALEDRVSPSFPLGADKTHRVITPLPDLIPSEEKITIPPQQQPSAELRKAVGAEKSLSKININEIPTNTFQPSMPAYPPKMQQMPQIVPQAMPYMMPYMMPPPPIYKPHREKSNETQTINAALLSTLNRAVDEMQFNTNRLNAPERVPPPSFQYPLETKIMNKSSMRSPRVQVEQILTPRENPVVSFINGASTPNPVDNDKQRYAAELREQMNQKEKAKQADRDKWAKMDAKLARECAEFDPWGKGGAGAPLKGKDGKPISDLRQMRAVNDRAELDADVSIEFTEATPRPGSTVLEDVRNEMLRHGVTKITDMYEPKKKVDTSYRAYLEEEIEKKERLKRERDAKQKQSDELEEKRIKAEQLKLKLEADREKQREMEKNSNTKEQNKLLMEKKKKDEQNHFEQTEHKIKLKRHKVINLDPEDWSHKQAELDAKIREARVAMTARSDGKTVAEKKRNDQLRQTGHEPLVRTPADTEMRGGKQRNDLKLDLSKLHDDPPSTVHNLKFNTQKIINDSQFERVPVETPLRDYTRETNRLRSTQKVVRPPSRTSLIDWGNDNSRQDSPPAKQYKSYQPKPSTVYHGHSLVSAKLDELRRRLEHQSLRLQHRVDHGYVKPSSPPRFQIHRGANAVTTSTEAYIQKDISKTSFGLQQAPDLAEGYTQTPVPTKSRSIETAVVMADGGNHTRPMMVQNTFSGPVSVLPTKQNRASLAKQTFTSISTGTYDIESDDAQIIVDDYVEAAETGQRDLSPDALLQIPNDDIDIFNAKLTTETNIVPAVDAVKTPSRNSVSKQSEIDLNDTDNDASPIKETVVTLPIKDTRKESPRKSIKEQSKIPRPAGYSPRNVSSGGGSENFDLLRAFKSRNKERLYKLKTFNDQFPSERNLLSRRERRKPGTSGRLLPAKASRPATVLLPKF